MEFGSKEEIKDALDKLFDNDEEVGEISISSWGKVMPPKRKQVALIDADTVIFATCLNKEYGEQLMPTDFYTEDEWNDIVVQSGYNEGEHTLTTIDLDDAYDYAMERVNEILLETGCTSYEMHFTGGRRSSFRYTDVDPNYKGNRIGKSAPMGLKNLKELFVEREPDQCYLWEAFEADDAVVAKKRAQPDKYLICAVDKDVLYSLPGEVFNYYTSVKYKIDMKFMDVSEEVAAKHHYLQTLTGDDGDNVIGLKGIGPAKANKILKRCKNEQQYWHAVTKAYDDAGRNLVEAVINMRLVNMHQVSYDPEQDKFSLTMYGMKTETKLKGL